MTKRPAVDPMESVVTEAPSVVTPAKKAAASLELHEDEVIQLLIRPSPWCIPLYSFKLVLALVLLAAAVVIAAQGRPTLAASMALAVIALGAFSAVLAATLQWASQLYVLTNRRVMRFHGVFSVHAAEYGLRELRGAQLHRGWHHLMMRMGSIQMIPVSDDQAPMTWEHVARPDEVYEILARAIRRAQSP